MGLAVNEWVIANAPLYYADLPQIAPWAIQGKAKALDLMDARLRVHSEISTSDGPCPTERLSQPRPTFEIRSPPPQDSA
jgi:hypothetical protein